MIIFDQPYLSEFLKETAVKLQIPVLKNKMAAALNKEKELRILEEAEYSILD